MLTGNSTEKSLMGNEAETVSVVVKTREAH